MPTPPSARDGAAVAAEREAEVVPPSASGVEVAPAESGLAAAFVNAPVRNDDQASVSVSASTPHSGGSTPPVAAERGVSETTPGQSRWGRTIPVAAAALVGIAIVATLAITRGASNAPEVPVASTVVAPRIAAPPEPEASLSVARTPQLASATVESDAGAAASPSDSADVSRPERKDVPDEDTEPAVSTVTVKSSPPGAMIFREDKHVGNGRVELMIRKGRKARLLALLNDHEPTRLTIDGSNQLVVIVLKPVGSKVPEGGVESSSASSTDAVSRASAAPAAPPQSSPRGARSAPK